MNAFLEYTPYILFLVAQVIGMIIAWNKFTNKVTMLQEKLNYTDREMRQMETKLEKLDATVLNNYETLNSSINEIKGAVIEVKTLIQTIKESLASK